MTVMDAFCIGMAVGALIACFAIAVGMTCE